MEVFRLDYYNVNDGVLFMKYRRLCSALIRNLLSFVCLHFSHSGGTHNFFVSKCGKSKLTVTFSFKISLTSNESSKNYRHTLHWYIVLL